MINYHDWIESEAANARRQERLDKMTEDAMSEEARIRPRVRDAILQSLRAGVTPRIGQAYIQVGRADDRHGVRSADDRDAAQHPAQAPLGS